MISISALVNVIFYIIIGAIIFGLLWWAIAYCEREFPSAAVFWKIARVILILGAAAFIIGVLLSVVGGVSLFKA